MKTVFITGVTRGIGRALVDVFLSQGYRVVGTYLKQQPDIPDGVTLIPLDLSSPESIAECATFLRAQKFSFDVVINNAGVLLDEDDTIPYPHKLRATLEVNLIGPIDLTEQILDLVVPGGHIVNVSSSAGSLERTGHTKSRWPNHYPAYKISKTALNMYTRTLSLRLKDSGTIVSSVHPGWVQTDMGGGDAGMTPTQSAQGIFEVVIARPPTGGFWFRGESMPW